MSNVVPLKRSLEDLLRRAQGHRMGGRYEEAMALLWRAREQYGLREEIELELAKTYDEMGCGEEAARSFLRVVRLGGEKRAYALFSLALSSFQNDDVRRAVSYFERFLLSGGEGVSQEMAGLMEHQLRMALEKPTPVSCKGRARELERRAVERVREGKLYAAIRTLRHVVTLCPGAQRYALLASCYLMQGHPGAALICAREAHRRSPGRVQPLCVLAEIHWAGGDGEAARRALYLAAMRAKGSDDLLCVSAQSARLGEDQLTLLLTGRLLRKRPYDMQAMMIRGCALLNVSRAEEAGRLFGRLCVLKPEDTVARAMYRLARRERDALLSGQPCDRRERLTTGLDVTAQEATERFSRLVAALYAGAEATPADGREQEELCQLAAWAFRSHMVGEKGAVLALMVLGGMRTQAARDVLLDALTDPQIGDGLKMSMLTALEGMGGTRHCDVDMGGQFSRLAAGGIVNRPVCAHASDIVQRVSDVLCARFPDAAETVLAMWIPFVERYAPPRRERRANAVAAALEALYHRQKGTQVDEGDVARRWGVSPRLCRLYMRRILRAADEAQKREEEKREAEKRNGAAGEEPGREAESEEGKREETDNTQGRPGGEHHEVH